MRKYLFKSLYRAVSFLSDFIDNRFLKKYKVFLGTSLLLLTAACQSQKKNNPEDRLCYASVPMPEDMMEVQTTDTSTISSDQISTNIPDTESDPGIVCYAPLLTEEDILIPPEPSCYITVLPDDTSDLVCYMGIDIKEENPIAEDTAVYIVVEEMPEFPGGTDSLMRYIEKNVKYPSGEICISGRVTVSFIIEKDGSISSTNVLRGIDAWFDKEALRVVRSMPKWKPGRQRGQEVRVKYTIPVRFK